MSSNPAGRVSREICAKNAATSMETRQKMQKMQPVVASPEKKNLQLFLAFFRIFILPSVNLCRVLFRHSAKPLPSARNLALGKAGFTGSRFDGGSLPSVALGKGFAECKTAFAECNRHSAKSRPPVVSSSLPPNPSATGVCPSPSPSLLPHYYCASKFEPRALLLSTWT